MPFLYALQAEREEEINPTAKSSPGATDRFQLVRGA
jgi:hypothetical protein